VKKKTPKEKYYVFYQPLGDEDKEWELDETCSSLADAEAYVKEKCEEYAHDEQDEPVNSAWEFHILKQVKVFCAKVSVEVKRNLILKEEQ